MTRFATYRQGGAPRVAIVYGPDNRLFDLAAAAGRDGAGGATFGSMLDLIDAGPDGLERARNLFERRGRDQDLSIPLGEAELLAPLPQPRQMRDGMSFETHIRQSGRGAMRLASGGDVAALAKIEAEPLAPLAEIYRQMPIYYITNRMIVRGPNSTVRWPRYSQVMDYELEFGIVLGRTGADVSAATAREHIFGFTIFNDFSARDQQMKEMAGRLGPAKGKSFDGANVLGPWIVTPDEIGDPYDLALEARVNGEVRCRSRTRDMLFSFEEIIAHMSQDETLFAGEFIGSGTVGNGCGLETGRFLEHGDEIALEVEKIGVLRNTVERQS